MKLLLSLFSLISLLLSPAALAEEFPGRATYPTVQVYETEQLAKAFDEVIIVDVRSPFEFETLHINNALNIPLDSKKFINELKALQAQNKPIIFYCNGHTCYKSYQAAKNAGKKNIKNVFAYDAGVFDWAKAYPERATLLGKTPMNNTRLIGKADLEKHMLAPAEFSAKIDDKTSILDIREPRQRGLTELFPYREVNIPLGDQKKLNEFLTDIKAKNKTLLVYDEAGKQVRWLQYYLEDKEIQNYYFMNGGVKNFIKAISN